MTTQYTSILKLALPVQGELSGTWGDVVNDNITSMVEEAVAGRAVINTWTTNSHVLTTADGTTAESRCAMLEFTDTGAALTGAATVVCPSLSKLYVCKNDSGQQVTIKTSAGTGVAIPDGQTMFVFCDGTNVEQCTTNFNSLSFNDYTLSFGGAVTTAGAFTTSGAYALTLTTTGATNVTLPTTGTLATLDGTETLTNKTLTAPTISSPTLTGSISATDLTISGDTTIGDAAADGLTVNATITSNLIFTDNTYDIGASGATRPRNLFLAGNATIGGTVTLSGGIDVTGALGVDGDFDVNTDKFTVASATGNTAIAGTLGVTGATTATGGLNVDTINEITAAGGVTIDSVVLKDGGATLTDDLVVDTDTLFVDASADKVMFGTTYNADGGVVTIRGTYGAHNASDYRGNNGLAITGADPGTTAAGSGVNLAFVPVTNRGATAVISGENTSTNKEGGAQLRFSVGGGAFPTTQTDMLMLNYNNGVIFNEGSADVDFRVESDSNTHMLFVDASTSRVGINNSSPSGLFELQETSGTVFDATDTGGQVGSGSTLSVQNLSDDTNSFSQILLRTRNTSKSVSRIASLVNGTGTDLVFVNEPQGSAPAERFRITKDGKFGFNTSAPISDVTIFSSDDPVLTLRDGKSGSTWVAGDGLGQLEYYTSDGTGIADHAVARIKTISGGSNSAGPDGVIVFETAGYNSTPTERFRLGNTDNTVSGAIFNEGAYNQDFRVESDSVANMFLVDAANNRVGVGTGNPAYTFVVSNSGAEGLEISAGGISANRQNIISYNRSGAAYNALWIDASNIVMQPPGGGGGSVNIGDSDTTIAKLNVKGEVGGNIARFRSGDTYQGFDFSGETTYGNGTVAITPNTIPGSGTANMWTHFATAGTGPGYTIHNVRIDGELETDRSATFNQGGNDFDFRVESDGNANMLVVDAGNNAVGIGYSGSTNTLGVAGTGNASFSSAKGIVLDYQTSSTSNVLPIGFSWSNSTSNQNPLWGMGFVPENYSSGTGGISFYTGNTKRMNILSSGAVELTGSSLSFTIADGVNINAAESLVVNIDSDNNDSGRVFQTQTGAGLVMMTNSETSGSIFNEGGADIDFRVESVNKDHMLFVDASADVVNIGSTAGAQTGSLLHVRRNASCIEWGHGNNTAGYFGTLGAYGNNGHPYIGWSTEADTENVNTFATYGAAGSIIKGDLSGNLIFAQVPNANATGQTAVERLKVSPTTFIVNDDSLDYDFRVESDSNSYGLFLDASTSAVGVNHTSSPGGYAQFVVRFSGSDANVNTTGIAIQDSGTNSNISFCTFFNSTGGGIGSITRVGTTNAVAYNTTSDRRAKENIADADDAGAVIDAIQVRKFDWIEGNQHQPYGMIAQELVEHAPEVVHQPVNEDEMMGVDYSKLVPMLVKEIQSLRARVAQLESN